MHSRLALGFVFALGLSGCGENPRDFFHVRRDGADLPVHVVGNLDSGVMIVHLHGGPGFTGLIEAETSAFERLSRDYSVVFWDQRGSGASQGNPTKASISMQSFKDDLALITDVLQERYDKPQLFLMGHSWGGAFGTAYLADPQQQARYAGWIEINGAHNMKGAFPHARQFVQDYAKNQDSDFWRDALKFYKNRPTLDNNDMKRHLLYVREAQGLYFDAEIESEFYDNLFQSLLSGPYNPLLLPMTYDSVLEEIDMASLDLTELLPKITIPSLVLWGRHDGLLPVGQAQATHQNLGTPANDKHVEIFEFSAHTPWHEEPDRFVQTVQAFVESHRSPE